MTVRSVTRATKAHGVVTQISGNGFAVSAAQAIREIEGRRVQYVVQVAGAGELDVLVAEGGYGKYLTTAAGRSTANSLDQLPAC